MRERITGNRVAWPERRLMVAVLQAAADDLRGSLYRHAAGHGASTDSRQRRAAVAYVARSDREWPFSFEDMRDALSLDPGRLRNALGRGPARKATRHRRRVPRAKRGVARNIVPLDVKAGDRILCDNSGAEITVDGEEVLIMREEDVLGVVEA